MRPKSKSSKPQPDLAALAAAIAAMGGGFQPDEYETQRRDWLHGGNDVQREFNKNMSFAVGISGDLIRESFIVLLYLSIARLILTPLMYWDGARPFALFLMTFVTAFAVAVYNGLPSLRWALTYRLVLIAIAAACAVQPAIQGVV